MITQEAFNKLIKQLRAQRTDDGAAEAKSCSGGRLSKDVWESVSSFANTSGGLLLLGVSEKDGFAPAENFDADRVRDQFVSGIGDGGGGSRVTNPPRYHINRMNLDGTQVLAIEVFESDASLKPCYITERGVQAGSFKRIDDKDIRLSPAEIYELQHVLTLSEADKSVVDGATIEDLDMQLIEETIKLGKKQGSRIFQGATTREKQLSRLGVTNPSGQVVLAGLLASGYYPQQFFPLLVVDVTVHPGLKKGKEGALRFLDRVICEGPLNAVVGDAVSSTMRNLRVASYVEGSSRIDRPEIPEEVLREAIANAVVHREYSEYFQGQSVVVDIYPDRVEVINPGGLWGGKTVETLDDGISCCRNAFLMKVLRSLPASKEMGVRVEGQGSGIAMMKNILHELQLPQPRFDAGADYFKVVFWRAENQRLNESQVPTEKSIYQTSDERVKAALSTTQARSVHELAESTGIKIDTVRSILRRLISAGSVEATAPSTSKKRKYLLVL